jgi:hypothetical protein
MDDGDPTTAGFKEFERVLDNAVNKFYEENARGDTAIVNVDNDSDDDVIVNINDNSDAPPNAHKVPSGSKRKLPLHMDVDLSTSADLSISVALLTSAALEIEEATSAALNLAAKKAIFPDAFSYGGFTYT